MSSVPASSHSPFSLVKLANGWTVGRFPALDAVAGVTHLVTTRDGLDVQLVRHQADAATQQAARAAGLSRAAWVHQVHGGRCLRVRAEDLAGRADSCLGQADALMTDEPGLGVSCRSADCPLILVAGLGATGRPAVGIAHASWRGTVQARITELLVGDMVRAFGLDPADLVACICPSAGPCCYEVRQDVLDEATRALGPQAERFFPRRDGRMYMDLWSANRDQLRMCGLSDVNIHVAGVCTLCRNDLFPSHRREGDRAGRFLAVIGPQSPS